MLPQLQPRPPRPTSRRKGEGLPIKDVLWLPVKAILTRWPGRGPGDVVSGPAGAGGMILYLGDEVPGIGNGGRCLDSVIGGALGTRGLEGGLLKSRGRSGKRACVGDPGTKPPSVPSPTGQHAAEAHDVRGVPQPGLHPRSVQPRPAAASVVWVLGRRAHTSQPHMHAHRCVPVHSMSTCTHTHLHTCICTHLHVHTWMNTRTHV